MTSFKIKNMDELWLSGWQVTLLGASRPKSRSLTPKHLQYVGKPVDLRCVPTTEGHVWVDIDSLLIWSRWAIVGDPKPRAIENTAVLSPRRCTCDIRSLWDNGCSCGGFKEEQRARKG